MGWRFYRRTDKRVVHDEQVALKCGSLYKKYRHPVRFIDSLSKHSFFPTPWNILTHPTIRLFLVCVPIVDGY